MTSGSCKWGTAATILNGDPFYLPQAQAFVDNAFRFLQSDCTSGSCDESWFVLDIPSGNQPDYYLLTFWVRTPDDLLYDMFHDFNLQYFFLADDAPGFDALGIYPDPNNPSVNLVGQIYNVNIPATNQWTKYERLVYLPNTY